MKRTVLCVATSDRPASERVRAAFVATAIAEHFRAQGKTVLLFVDSLTRFAMAQREVGLAVGEPPTTRAIRLAPLLCCRSFSSERLPPLVKEVLPGFIRSWLKGMI